jgi:hypothetical protein
MSPVVAESIFRTKTTQDRCFIEAIARMLTRKRSQHSPNADPGAHEHNRESRQNRIFPQPERLLRGCQLFLKLLVALPEVSQERQ